MRREQKGKGMRDKRANWFVLRSWAVRARAQSAAAWSGSEALALAPGIKRQARSPAPRHCGGSAAGAAAGGRLTGRRVAAAR